MGVFYGNFNPDATFISDIGSITRLATSAPFGRYLQEEIFQRSAFYTSGILGADARLNNTIGTRVELPFFRYLMTYSFMPLALMLKSSMPSGTVT